MAFLSYFSLLNTPNYTLLDHHEQNKSNYNPTTTTTTTSDDPNGGSAEENYEFNWSTSLIPLPLYHITDSIKRQLPVMEYSSFLLQNKKSSAANLDGDDDEHEHEHEYEHDECAVCLNPVEGTHLVRELWNCSHVFHKDCLDGWIDKSNVTCPLCRADLLPAAAHQTKQAIELRKCPWN